METLIQTLNEQILSALPVQLILGILFRHNVTVINYNVNVCNE